MVEEASAAIEEDVTGTGTVTFTTPVEEQTFPNWADNIPKEHVDKSWLKEIPDHQTAVKMLIDQKTALSSRPGGIPQDNASMEEIAAFNKALGVPDTGNDYKFSELAEGQTRSEDFEKGIRQLMKESNITAKQFEKLEPGFNQLMTGLAESIKPDSAYSNADFDKLASETFGDNQDKVMKLGDALISQHVPENMRPHVASLSNESLIIMAGILDSVAKEHISEDRMPDFVNPMAGMTEENKIAEGTRLMATKEYKDSWDPNNAATVEKVQKLFGTWQG